MGQDAPLSGEIQTASRDFFLSYADPDREWAEWIAGRLEEQGYTVSIRAWDVRPGMNRVLAGDRQQQAARQTLLLLSPASLEEGMVAAQSAVAMERDPRGEKRLLIPIRVKRCELTGLLGSLVPIELVDLGEEQAVAVLLEGVSADRPKPSTLGPFPGSSLRAPFPGMLPPRPHIFQAPALPKGYVSRPAAFGEIKRLLLERQNGQTTAITTALRGAGGFGKTTLALALCHDPEIQAAFPDGILWVELGEQPKAPLDLLNGWLAALERPHYPAPTVEEARDRWRVALEERVCLLVIDDVWQQ